MPETVHMVSLGCPKNLIDSEVMAGLLTREGFREKKEEGKNKMKDEGWSFGDLAGELWARGIDINDIDPFTVYDACLIKTAERAANYIERQEDRCQMVAEFWRGE